MPTSLTESKEAKEALLNRIEAALDTIRPYLLKDGGNVEIVEVTPAMELKLRLQGSCESCSMSAMTMRAGVEKTVIRSVPEIVSVIAVNAPAAAIPRF